MNPICNTVTVVGGGLAGSEAAWQLAKRGLRVKLCEMRPIRNTPAHETALLGELVCSNSLGGDKPVTPAGILKAELHSLDSLIMDCAEKSRVPAGNALAVDREKFATRVNGILSSHPLIEVIREEVTDIPEGPAIIASGPLTSNALAQKIAALVGDKFLYFYDAVAPVVTLDSIDVACSFRGNRYGDSGDYINCPMDEKTYHDFWQALVSAETAPLHEFELEEIRHFEGCLPIEVIAKRGEKTLLFGPLRPVGLSKDDEGKNWCAIVQLRQDNTAGTLFNMVGFQTNLKWHEQERVFRMIPALKNAEFVRKGVMHRNIFICAPECFDRYLRIKDMKKIFFAGQITGVEGYVESTAMGLASALFMYSDINNLPMPDFPSETAIGSLLNYLNTAVVSGFQPMNVNLGIFPELPGKRIHKRALRCMAYAERSTAALDGFIKHNPDLMI